MRRLLLCTSLLLLPLSLTAQARHTTHGSALHWGPAPAVFAPGARMAVVSGDPSKAAPFTIQLAMPDGYRIAPHFHPSDEKVVVKRGTLMVGQGDTFDTGTMKPLRAGQHREMPAKMRHYVAAKGPTVVSVSAVGPFGMTYVNPADDPQHAAKK
jgi:quercetin dioxygenase-like cupin family protein